MAQTVELTVRGESVRQIERHLLVRLPTADADLGESVREAHQRDGIVAARWWSLKETEATAEQILPADLAHRLRGLRTGVAGQEEEAP